MLFLWISFKYYNILSKKNMSMLDRKARTWPHVTFEFGKTKYQCIAMVDLISFWASDNHKDTNKGQRFLHTLYGYQIQLGVWEALQTPQWIQGEVLIEETRRSQEQRNGTPENHLKLYQNKNFALFYIKFKPSRTCLSF